jgi:hypothetical protein
MHRLNILLIALALLLIGCTKTSTNISPNAHLSSGHGLVLVQVTSEDPYTIVIISSNRNYSYQEDDLSEVRFDGNKGSKYWLLELPAGNYRIDTINGMRSARGGIQFFVKSASVNYIGDIDIAPVRVYMLGKLLVHESWFDKNHDLQGAKTFLTENYPRHSKELPFIDAAQKY